MQSEKVAYRYRKIFRFYTEASYNKLDMFNHTFAFIMGYDNI